MALTRERKIFIGILALAGGALALDMGLLRGPASASASEGEPLATEPESLLLAESAREPGDLLSRLGADLGPGLAGVLEAYASREGVSPASAGDAFAWPEAWTAAPAASARESKPVPAGPLSMPKVTSVMPKADGGGLAIIGGRTLRVGQLEPTLRATILEIRPDGVVIELDGRVLALPLESPARGASQPEPSS